MKKILMIGCLVLVILFGATAFAAWKFLPPLLNQAMERAASSLQDKLLPDDLAGLLQHDPQTIQLTEISGEVYLTHADIRDAIDADTDLAAGDVVETGADGSAAILWPGYGRTLLDHGSQVTVTEGSEESGGTILNAKLNLGFGRIWTRLERLLGRDSGFEVRASNVVATVRGTSFGVTRPKIGGLIKIQVVESNVGIKKMKSADSDEIAVPEVLLAAGTQMDVSENVKEAFPKPVRLDPKMQSDPFFLEGNMKIPQEVMDWYRKMMLLFNDLPKDRQMTEFELLDFERRLQELYNATTTLQVDTKATILIK